MNLRNSVDNQMIAFNVTRFGNINTYLSDDGTKVAWIDHVLARAVKVGFKNLVFTFKKK